MLSLRCLERGRGMGREETWLRITLSKVVVVHARGGEWLRRKMSLAARREGFRFLEIFLTTSSIDRLHTSLAFPRSHFRVIPIASTMLGTTRTALHPPLSAAALRNASRLGLRRFSRQLDSSSLPPRGWVPTPYVTETIVCPPPVITQQDN